MAIDQIQIFWGRVLCELHVFDDHTIFWSLHHDANVTDELSLVNFFNEFFT